MQAASLLLCDIVGIDYTMCSIRNVGVHELVKDSIEMCDGFLQKDLYNNIVLSGGTSMLPGGLLEF